MDSQQLAYDQTQKLSFNRFEREGYLFTGWNTDPDGSGESYTNEQAVLNLASTHDKAFDLYAQWKPIDYYVVFDAQGGTGAMPDQTLVYDQVAPLQKNLLSREGFRWVGWDTSPSVPVVRYYDQALVKNLSSCANDLIVLYAVWAAHRYLVVFDANGGTGTMETQAFAYSVSERLHPNAFSRLGYRWCGWNTHPDGTGDAYKDEETVCDLSTVDNSIVTLFAQWAPEPYEPQPDPGIEEPPTEQDSEQPSTGEDPVQNDPVPSDPAPNDPDSSNSASDDPILPDQNPRDPSSSLDGPGEDNQSVVGGSDRGASQNQIKTERAQEAEIAGENEKEDPAHERAVYDRTGASISLIAQFVLAGLLVGAAALFAGIRQHRSEREQARRSPRSHLRS